jgi:hypothetical protein
MSMLNNIVGYWAYIINTILIKVIRFKLPQLGAKMLIKIPRVGMQLMIKYPTYAQPPPPPLGVNIDRCIILGGGLYLGVYIWNEVSVIIAVIFRESEVYSIQLKKLVFSCHRHTFLGAYRTAYTLGSQVDPMEI